MTGNLKSRVARLEAGGAHGVEEVFLENNLPDYPGEPSYAVIRREKVYMAEDETEAAFRERCRSMAGRGETIAYCLWHQAIYD